MSGTINFQFSLNAQLYIKKVPDTFSPPGNDANLVSYYRMEGNSNDSKDGNNGTDTSITYSSGNGKFNQGAGFGGSSVIDLGDPANLDIGQMSVSFWMQVGSLAADSVVASKWYGSGASSWVIYIDGAGTSGYTDKIRFIISTNGEDQGWANHATSNDVLTTGTWYYVVGTYDGSTVKMYVNGDLQNDATSVSGSIFGGTAHNKIGAWLAGSGTNLPNGSKIDDFAIFSRALTATEVSDLYLGPINQLQNLTYAYDANGNITQIADTSETNTAKTVVYTYDDLNRLTNASSTLAATSTNYRYSYTYDALGSIQTRVENNATTTYTYATSTAAYLNPHAVATTTVATSTSFTYDNNGNLTSLKMGATTTAAYVWDYNNRLTQATSTNAISTFAYDPWGQRTKMTVATTSSATTYYPTKEYNITGSVPTKHIFLPDGTLVATVVGTGTSTTVSYVHVDHLGGANVSTSDAGEVVQIVDIYPYGTFRLDEQNGFNEQRKGISGHEYDPTSSLTYMNSRYFNGANAKFISQDPAFWDIPQEYIEDPQQWNSYNYARNNPIVNTDPTGESAAAGTMVLGGGGALAAGELIVGTYVLGGTVVVVGGTVGAYYGIRWVLAGPDSIGNQSTPSTLLSTPNTNTQSGQDSKPKIEIKPQSKPQDAPKPEDLKGKTPEEIGKILKDKGWEPIDPSRGGGDRWVKPGTKGSDQIRLEKGNPNDSNPVKRGPYGRISEHGDKSEPIPLKGNPTLNK